MSSRIFCCPWATYVKHYESARKELAIWAKTHMTKR